MARKKVDERAAKEKRQKKIAAGGALLLVILMAVQVPRTMKMLDEGAAATPAPAATTTAAPAGAAPPAGAPGDASTLAPPTLEGANPATPVSAPTLNRSAQLISFSQFESKDPFAQQVDPELVAAAPAGGEPADEASEIPLDQDGGAEASAGNGAVGGSASPGSTTAPTSATVAVNGVEEAVAVAGTFPQASPLFLLSSLTAKTAKIKVAEGGSFAAGDAALTLELKKPVTLVNTADGSRFVVELRSIP